MGKTSEIEHPMPVGNLHRERERAASRIRASARQYVAALLAADSQGQENGSKALEESGRSLGEIDQAIELSDLAGGSSSFAHPVPHAARLAIVTDPKNADPRCNVPVSDLVASALSLLLDETHMDPFDVAIRSGIPEATIRSILDGDQPATLTTVASIGRAAGGQLIFGFVPRQPSQDEDPPAEIEAAAISFAADPERGNRLLIRAALRLAAHAGVPGAAARAELESLRSLRDLVLAIRDDLAHGEIPHEIKCVESLNAALARRSVLFHVEHVAHHASRAERTLASRSMAGPEAMPCWIAQRSLLLRAIFVVREIDPKGADDGNLEIEVSVSDREIARGSIADVERTLRASDIEVKRGERIVVRAHDTTASWVTIVPIVVWA